jgi:hypothetical protein
VIGSLVTLRNVVVGLSCFAAGLATYLALAVHLRTAVRDRDAWPLAYAANFAAMSVIILMIAEAVFRVPALPWTRRVITYSIALGVLFVSAVFIGADHRRRNRREGD